MKEMLKTAFCLGAAVAAPLAQAAAGGLVYVPEGSASEVLVLDQESNQIVDRLPDLPEIHGLSGTPDGSLLVAGSLAESTIEGQAMPAKPQGMAQSEHAAHHQMVAKGSEQPKTVSYVSIIRPDDGGIVRRLEVGGAVHHTAVAPDGRFAVATHPGLGQISVIDLASYQVSGTVATGPMPNYAVVTSDGGKVYVSNAGNGTVSEVDAERWIVRRNFAVGNLPEHLVLSPGDRRLYVANVQDGTVSEIALPAGTVERTFEVGGIVHGLDLAADGSRLFVSAREANQLAAIDLASGAIERRDLGPAPYHLTAGRGADKIYVTSAEEPKLWVLDAKTLDVVTEVATKDIGHQMVVVQR